LARKGGKVNRRKKSSSGLQQVVAVVLISAVIAAGFYLLGRNQEQEQPPTTKSRAHASATSRMPIPARPTTQDDFSSASMPPAKSKAAAPKGAQGGGKVAIIIDDMGASMQEVQSLLSIKLPVTFSVIPSLAHARGVAEAAHGAGAQVMVHMPMEPEGYPKQPMEKIGLLLSMSDSEITDRVNGYFTAVPFAVGANNHMGSRFTQDADKMETVLDVLKQRGVFFVDSRTTPASIGYEKAKIVGVKSATRQVFLDNVQDEAAIAKQLEQAAAIARKKGTALAIGHPHPATIRALKATMPQLAHNGITFVSASALTH
jgi:uncharacterized protein